MKTRPVIWSRNAHKELDGIFDYIAHDNPTAASRVVEKILETGNSLGECAVGHMGRMENVREVGVSGYPYTIAYSIEALSDNEQEAIYILHIIHQARDWTAAKWPD